VDLGSALKWFGIGFTIFVVVAGVALLLMEEKNNFGHSNCCILIVRLEIENSSPSHRGRKCGMYMNKPKLCNFHLSL